MKLNILIADENLSNLDTLVSAIKSSINNVDITIINSSENILTNHEKNNLLICSDSFINNYDNKFFNNILLNKLEKNLSTQIINTINNPIFVTDCKKILYANKSFLKLLNFTSIEEINNSFKDINNLFVTKSVKQNDETNTIFFGGKNLSSNWLNNIKNNNEQKICIKNDDNLEDTYILNSTILDDGYSYIINMENITKEIKHTKELKNLLFTDSLTNLPNRTKLIEDLQNLDIKSIAIIDIDSFKEINDFYGHRIGDTILIGIAEIMYKSISVNKNLNLYKLTADTYCITNINNDEHNFTLMIKKILSSIEKKIFTINQNEIDPTVTAGISYSTKNNKLITADLALQSAKKDRKNYLVFYDELDNINEYQNNMIWTKKLKYALQNDNIIVYYQPLINNKTLEVDKYECLVRMIDEDRIISPFYFLNISKKSNQYSKITRVVIEKSFKEFQHLPFEFSVNISYEDIEDPSFLTFIKSQLKKYNLSDKVVFEILEDENIKNYDILITFINEIKDLGCKVAIDDFGSGYSNFEHLLKMNIDFLKIDASLIKNIANNQNSYKITRTIIEFAKSLNLKTIAEFVENKEIFEIVKDLGADYSQGYYFSEPVSVPNIYKCR